MRNPPASEFWPVTKSVCPWWYFIIAPLINIWLLELNARLLTPSNFSPIELALWFVHVKSHGESESFLTEKFIWSNFWIFHDGQWLSDNYTTHRGRKRVKLHCSTGVCYVGPRDLWEIEVCWSVNCHLMCIFLFVGHLLRGPNGFTPIHNSQHSCLSSYVCYSDTWTP